MSIYKLTNVILRYSEGSFHNTDQFYGKILHPVQDDICSVFLNRFPNRTSLFILLIPILLFSCQNPEKPISIGFVGDILLDRGVRKRMEMEGQAHFYADIKKQLPKLDYLIGNLECPVTEIRNPVHKKFIFRGDTSNLPYLKKIGFTHLNMANNHSYDQGRPGMIATAEAIINYEMPPLGYGLNRDLACEPIFIETGRTKVILLASVFLPLENWMPLSNSPSICQANYEELGEKVKALKEKYPHSVIIVNLHWGVEHITEPTRDQVNQGHHLIDQGADLIIGHHPHVIQPKEVYRGKEIYYSLGNFIFDQSKPLNSRALLVKAEIANGKIFTSEVPYYIEDCKPQLVE